MITDKDIEQLYKESKIQKATLLHSLNKKFDIYFYELDHIPSAEEIYNKHNINIAFSEWWEFYSNRESLIRQQLGKNNTIPLTSFETCVNSVS